MNEAIILANGEFPEHQIPLEILNLSHNLICCDGAVNKLDEIGVMPTLILGDFFVSIPTLWMFSASFMGQG